MDLVRSLGADAIIDYTKDDFTQLDERYDLIVVFGGGDSVSRLRRALTPKGTLVVAGGEGGGKWLGRGGRLIYAPLLSPFVSQRLVGFGVKHNSDDLSALRTLIEAGKVTPVIGRTYQLSEVPTAMRDLKAGRAEAARSSSRSENRVMPRAPITRPSRTPDGSRPHLKRRTRQGRTGPALRTGRAWPIRPPRPSTPLGDTQYPATGSFESPKGPSRTVRFPSENMTRLPSPLGCSPARSRSTPASLSSSLYFPIAVSSSSLGCAPASDRL